MRKTIAMAVAAVTLPAGMALADDPARAWSPAPQSIAEVRTAGMGTVAGTVTAIGDRGLVLEDGTGTLWVGTKHLDCEGVKPGQQATVAGRFKDDEFRARQLIREDGTEAASQSRKHRRERQARIRGD